MSVLPEINATAARQKRKIMSCEPERYVQPIDEQIEPLLAVAEETELRPSRSPSAIPPFLKWAGGKKLLLPKLLPYVPTRFGDYFEPFMGGAALFFALGPRKGYLSDLNPHLVETFLAVRDDVDAVLEGLDKLPIEVDLYYQIRASKPATPIERAVRFIYLNKTCWNGLYRENRKGEFNVPFGLRDKQHSLVVSEPEKLRAASKRLEGADISVASFRTAALKAKAGDFVYFDPPYTVSHNNNGFIEYNASIFSWKDQEDLAAVARELRDRGCHILISNADHEAIHQLYADFRLVTIERSSTIAGIKTNRRRVTELVITTYD